LATIDTAPSATPVVAASTRVLIARGLRAFGDGYVSLLLPLYLLELGFGPLAVGLIATATLLGSGALTLLVGMHAHRHATRTLLLAAALLMAVTGAGFAAFTSFWPLLLIAIVGTLNPSSGDVSVFLPLEHALLSQVASDRNRTALFARYSVVGSLLAAVGALAAGLPTLLAARLGISMTTAMQAMFVLYGALGLLGLVVYRRLPVGPPSAQGGGAREVTRPAALGPSKRAVYLLAGLFSLDAFAGGFVVQSMVALWLYQRFDLSAAAAGSIFFWTGILSAVSFLIAVRIARRIGLVNTMVFTHLPANCCLIALPWLDSLSAVVVVLFIRSLLSQMDVPTRSSYVMAIVTPAERPAAASVTSVPRSLAAAASPFLAGWLLSLSSFGWPLLAAGALKVVYDLLLLVMFRRVRPPEES
jgi:MFS family permease